MPAYIEQSGGFIIQSAIFIVKGGSLNIGNAGFNIEYATYNIQTAISIIGNGISVFDYCSTSIKVPQWYAVQVSDTTMMTKEQMFVPQKNHQLLH
jgi:hypothetical protein